MVDVQKRISIITEFLTKGAEVQQKAVQNMTNAQYGLWEAQQRMQVSQRKMGNLMQETNMAVNDQGMFYDTVTDKMYTMEQATNRLRNANNRFKGEYLSLMFTAMALNRVFSGFVTSQFEAWGISELFSATIMMIMLPAMEGLLNLLIPVFEWFMNLSDTSKFLIGWGAIIGTVITGIMMWLGMLLLGWDGIIKLAPWIPKVITTSISAATGTFNLLTRAIGLGGMGATIGATAALVGLMIVIAKYTEENAFSKKLEEQADLFKELGDAARKAGDDVGYYIAQLAEKETRLQKVQFDAGVGGTRMDLAPTFTPSDVDLANIQGAYQSIVQDRIRQETSNDINIQASYNVTVADKREFEQMLKNNNQKLTEDIRRLAQV